MGSGACVLLAPLDWDFWDIWEIWDKCDGHFSPRSLRSLRGPMKESGACNG